MGHREAHNGPNPLEEGLAVLHSSEPPPLTRSASRALLQFIVSEHDREQERPDADGHSRLIELQQLSHTDIATP